MDILQALRYPFIQRNRRQVWIISIVLGAIPYIGTSLVETLFLPVASSVARGEDAPNLLRQRGIWAFAGTTVRLIVLQLILLIAMFILIVAALLIVRILESFASGIGTTVLLVAVLVVFAPGIIAIAMVLQAGTARFALTNSLGAGLDFGLIVAALRAQPLAWFLSAILPFCVGAPFGFALRFFDPNSLRERIVEQGAVALLTAFTIPVGMHLIGQAYRRSNNVIERRQETVVSYLLEGNPRFH